MESTKVMTRVTLPFVLFCLFIGGEAQATVPV